MGKAKRFNSYDSDVEDKRKIAQNYGLARQNLSGIGSSFRSSPLSPITSSSNPDAFSSGADNLGNHLATQDLDMNGNDILLSSDQTTKINVTGTTAFFLSAGSEVFRIGSTELQMAKQIDMNDNNIVAIAGLDLDGATATIQGVVNLDLYQTTQSINSLSGILSYQAATGDVHRFSIGGVTEFEIGASTTALNSDLQLEGGKRLASSSATEIGIFVRNETGTIGTLGTVQLPEYTATTAPTNGTLDTNFGAFQGSSGIFRDTDTTAGSRFYIRGSDGNWYYSFLTQQT